jgi:hypothetical protein
MNKTKLRQHWFSFLYLQDNCNLAGTNGAVRGQVTDAICAKFSLCSNVNDQFRYRVRFGRNKWRVAGSGDWCNLCLISTLQLRQRWVQVQGSIWPEQMGRFEVKWRMQSALNSHFAATSTISSGTGFNLGGTNGAVRGQVTDAICAQFSLCSNVNAQFRYRVRFRPFRPHLAGLQSDDRLWPYRYSKCYGTYITKA